MGQLDRSIDAVDRDMAELAATSTVAAGRVDNLGDQARQSATAMTMLDARIKATRLSVRDLGLEFARTGDQIDGRNLSKEQSLLNKLERLKKSLQEITPGVPGGGGSGGGAAAGAGVSGLGRMSASNPVVIGAIGGAITAAALGLPTLGAMIAGIVAGGIGTGGVIGGVAMASRDPHLRDAAADTFKVITDEFFAGGGAFVKPTIKALEILQAGFKKLDLGDMFAKVAPDVEIIAHGLDNMVRNVMPGLNKAFDHMKPFADAASEGMAELGSAVGDFMDSVTSSEGAVMGLEAAFNLVNNTIVALGGLLEWLSNGFERFVNVLTTIAVAVIAAPWVPREFKEGAEFMLHELEDLKTHGRDWANTAGDGTHAIESMGEAADTAAVAVSNFNDELDKVYNKFLDLEGAEVNAEAAIDDLADALEKNGITWDKNTEAGRENVTQLIDVARASQDVVRKILAQNGSVEDATAAYDHMRQELYDTLIQSGETAEGAQALVDKWLSLDALGNITKTFTIYETKIRATYGPDPGTTWGGGFQEFAGGGMVLGPPGSPQLVVAHAGEQVLTKQQQAQQWNGSTASTGIQYLAQPFVYSGRNSREAALIEEIREAVSARGGTLAVLGLRN